MPSPVTVTEIASVPSDASVRHVDELSDRARERLFEILFRDSWTTVESTVASELLRNDVVKFTAYYRITPGESPPDGQTQA